MNWSSFQRKFHSSWHSKMRPFIESKECDSIFAHLKARGQEGEKIAPTSHNTFKAFEIPMDIIKVVMLGGNPYDGFIDGIPVANGLLYDCSTLEMASYELRNFNRGLEIEMYNGLSLHYTQDYSVKHLTKQGVMMLNASLTTEQYGTHSELWRPFTEHVISIISDLNVPVIMLGGLAQGYTTMKIQNRVFHIDEPAGTPKEWDTKGTFQKVDSILEDNNQDTIMWLHIDCPF